VRNLLPFLLPLECWKRTHVHRTRDVLSSWQVINTDCTSYVLRIREVGHMHQPRLARAERFGGGYASFTRLRQDHDGNRQQDCESDDLFHGCTPFGGFLGSYNSGASEQTGQDLSFVATQLEPSCPILHILRA